MRERGTEDEEGRKRREEEKKQGRKKALTIEAKGKIVACPRLYDITENYFDTC